MIPEDTIKKAEDKLESWVELAPGGTTILDTTKKLKEKGLDYIIANTTQAIGSDVRSVILLNENGIVKEIKNKPLLNVAYSLLQLTT